MDIVFLSTPHRGSESAEWASIMANVVKASTYTIAAWTGSVRKDLLDTLKKDSKELTDLAKEVRSLISKSIIISCYETLSTPPLKTSVSLSIIPEVLH